MKGQPSATEFLKAALGTAHYFGFQSVDDLKAHPDCKECDRPIGHKASASDRRTDALHGLLTSGMATYFENKLHAIDGPALFYTTNTVPRTGETAIALHVLNVKKSIAEALLIQTVRAILTDTGFDQYTVRINSLGDQDSVARYIRELTNYLRKRIHDLPPASRELMKEHVFNALMYLVEKEHEFGLRSPSPLEYLSDQSRRHFREVIEFLDMSETPYEIDSKLLGHHQCYSETLFAVDLPGDEQPLYIRGGRYNTFVSRMTRSETPAAGAVLVLRNQKAPQRMPRPKRGAVPSVSVVQLGFGPKIKSLLIVNELRQAGIPVTQDVVSDSLSEQLRKAEQLNTRFAVIVGQKEYVEGSVILRDLHSRSQENVPVSGLVNYLKRVA